MMINTSTFSKGLIIFLVYYLEITLIEARHDDEDTNIPIQRTIEIKETLFDLMKNENNGKKFKTNLKAIQNNDNSTIQQHEKVIPSIQMGIISELLNGGSYPLFNINSDLNDMYLRSTITFTKTSEHFIFYAYAPHIFDSLRKIFGIDKLEYISSLCNKPLKRIQNPGASRSQLYFTEDNKFIMKTIQSGEESCLSVLISKYQMHFGTYMTSLLPKFSGFYGVQLKLFSVFKVVTMNNLQPSNIQFDEKFDLKGSTLGRNASENEKTKPLPTFKDLDFKNMYPSGILLEKEIYSNLLNILQNDCKLLESLKIMDYSLLMIIFNIDRSLKNKKKKNLTTAAEKKWKNAMDRITKGSIHIVNGFKNKYEVSFRDAIPAKNQNGERILLFVGIIDVLQTYETKKTLELKAKTLALLLNPLSKENSESISVQPPDTYAKRFIQFISNFVFTTSERSNTATEDEKSASKN